MKDKRIGLEIRITQSLMTRYIIKHLKKNDKFFSAIQIDIMIYLSKAEENVYQKDLEKEFNLRKSTISGILKTMEKNEIIEKLETKEDYRSKQIILTQKGKEISREYMIKLMQMEKLMQKGIDEQEVEIFLKVINQIKSNLKE